MDIPITVFLVAALLLIYFKFPQFVEDSCTSKKNFDIKQWLLSIFHHVSKGQFAYQIGSLLWKGTLLEGSIGSRRFASMILKLLVTNEGILIMLMAAQGRKLWGAADLYPFICHGHLWKILFGMYGFLPPVYQNRNALIIAAIFAADLTFIYFLYPVIPLFGPVCGTLEGLLCSYAPQFITGCWKMVRSSCPSPMIEMQASSDMIGLVWICESCTYENGVFLDFCESCGTPREVFADGNSVMDDSLSSLVSGMPNQELDRRGLIWTCMSCTFENGVFLDVCESCRTDRGYFASDNSVMDASQRTLISQMPNPALDKTDLVWNCMSCTFENGVYVQFCEMCGTPSLISD